MSTDWESSTSMGSLRVGPGALPEEYAFKFTDVTKKISLKTTEKKVLEKIQFQPC